MKKFIVAILAILYVGSSVGATVHLHYCMDKLVSSELWHDESDACSNCGMEKGINKDGCCKDEQKQVKIDSDHKAADILELQQLAAIAIIPEFTQLPLVDLPTVSEEFPLSNAPPRSSKLPVFLRNRSFLI